MKPQFFDIFGAVGFIYIVILAAFGIQGRRLPKWSLMVLLLIGIIGLIVDVSVVYMFYLR